jgi:malate permease and related proteins
LADIINLVLIPVLMVLGVLLARAKLGLKASHLEFLIIYFTAPILLFTEMAKADLSNLSLSSIVGISFACMALYFVVSYAMSRKLDDKAKGTVVLNATFINSIFLPFPIIFAFYGDLSIALLFALPTMIVHNTIGVFLASYWGHGKISRNVLIKAVTYPPLLGFLVGILAQPLLATHLTTPAFEWLHNLGLTTIYLSLIYVGLAIPISKDSLFVFRNRVTRIITLNRLLISPILMLILIAIFKTTGVVNGNLLIMSLMPPAVTNLLMVSRFGLDVKSTCQSIFLPTLMSLAIIFVLRLLAVL